VIVVSGMALGGLLKFPENDQVLICMQDSDRDTLNRAANHPNRTVMVCMCILFIIYLHHHNKMA